MTSERSGNQQLFNNSSTIPASTTTSRSSTPKPSDLFSSSISGKMDQFMDMQNRLMQQMRRPNKDRMKEVFIDYIRESVYEIHPTLWEEMHRDIMNTVLMYKDKDNELKMGHKGTATATAEPFRSIACWQPPPHMWPSTVQNPGSVWGSTKPAWVNQQFPQHQQFSQQQQSQQQQQSHTLFQSQQQQTSSGQQQRHQEKQLDTPLLSTNQFTPITSTPLTAGSPDTSFPSGLSSLLDDHSLDQHQGQQEDDYQK